jgi:hypothetical protein
MDPYLEDDKLWPAFQHQLVGCLFQILLPGLVDRYRARIVTRRYFTEMPLFTSVIREEHNEEYVEIRQRTDNRLVTTVDIASPSNKLSPEGRAAYTDTRRQNKSQGASLVEIDLILRGQPLLDYPRDGLPEMDYAVTVSRSSMPDRFEIYTTTLQKRLQRFKLPLAADDRDTVVDLQVVFARSFDQGSFAGQIDYKKDPIAIRDEAKLRYVHELLTLAKVRS